MIYKGIGVLFLLALAACGGGGGDPSPGNTPSDISVPSPTDEDTGEIIVEVEPGGLTAADVPPGITQADSDLKPPAILVGTP